VAQLVEHHLAQVGVAGSTPVVRSRSEAVSKVQWLPAGDSLGDSAVHSLLNDCRSFGPDR
jgi:hypothetical protein